MERKFLTFVRILSIIVSGAMLFLAIAGVVMAFYIRADIAEVSNKLRLPMVELGGFEKSVIQTEIEINSGDKTLMGNLDTGFSAQVSGHQKQLDEPFASMFANMNKYLKKYNAQELMDEESFRKEIDERVHAYEDSALNTAYVTQLSDVVTQVSTAPNVIKSQNGRSLSWVSLLQWFDNEFQQQVNSAYAKVQTEQMQADKDIESASNIFVVALTSFTVFWLFTVLLVLLRIELNTRTKE